MKKRIILSLMAIAAIAVGVVGMSAFEAHVINVTAKIENALAVSPDKIEFGTVFPQEYLTHDVTVALSGSFLDEDRVDDVSYFIRQKPKPRPEAIEEYFDGNEGAARHWCYEHFPDGMGDSLLAVADNGVSEEDYYDRCYYNLCPYLSKHSADENDGDLDAFHRMGIDVPGYLAKSDKDIEDIWTIDLDVPCFDGMCAQDWTHQGWELPADLEHEMFGCDLWIEVNGISETPPPDFTCYKWECLTDLVKDFFVTGRADNTNWDMAIWTGNPDTVRTTGEFAWGDNQPVNFSVDYDPVTGVVTYNLGGAELTYNYGACKAFTHVIPFVKGNATHSAALTGLTLNGQAVDDLNSNGDYWGEQVPLSDADQADGFTLTGTATLDWEGTHPQEIPAFHVFAMGTHDLPNCED